MGDRIRSERSTRVDLMVTAAIFVAVIVAGLSIWATSDARQTTLVTAPSAPAVPPAPAQAPQVLTERWTAPSPATRVPQVLKSGVVTADGGEIAARELPTGGIWWRYQRNLDVCGALTAWRDSTPKVIAVYKNSRGCSEVTGLKADTGERFGARTSDADPAVSLSYDGDYVLSAGSTRLETWGSNLVRGIEYGRVDAPVNPKTAPQRSDCRMYSALTGASKIGVVERCDGDLGYRLTVLGAAQDSDEKITQWGTTMLTTTSHGPPPRLVALSSSAVSVYDGGVDGTGETARTPGPRIRVFSPQAEAISTHPVNGRAEAPTQTDPVRDTGIVSFWTGTDTVIIDPESTKPLYQIPGTIGTATVMAGELLVPIPGRISVRQLSDGRELRSIDVRRAAGTTSVALASVGPYVLEQRGATITALS